MVTAFTVNAQDNKPSKEETLNYIKETYGKINRIFIYNDTYLAQPSTINFVKLEGDKLIISYGYGMQDREINFIISGEIKIGYEEISGSDCLINTYGDKYMFVQGGNKSQLDRLKNAVINLQQFITKDDPFQN